jgi:hypothetical protein
MQHPPINRACANAAGAGTYSSDHASKEPWRLKIQGTARAISWHHAALRSSHNDIPQKSWCALSDRQCSTKPDSVHVVFDAAIQSGDHYTLSGSAEQQTDPRRHDERPALRYYSELPTDSCRLSERSKSAPLPASKRIPGAYGIQIAAPGPAA